MVIKALSNLKNFKKVILFAGPILENSYEKKIRFLITKYNLENKVIFSGPLFEEEKWGSILASKGMVLASHGENFGVSLVESMSFGKPVITTNKVNIYKEIMSSEAGLVSNNTANGFTNILNKFDQMSNANLKKMSKNSIKCFKKYFDLNDKKNSLGSFLLSETKKMKKNSGI